MENKITPNSLARTVDHFDWAQVPETAYDWASQTRRFVDGKGVFELNNNSMTATYTIGEDTRTYTQTHGWNDDEDTDS